MRKRAIKLAKEASTKIERKAEKEFGIWTDSDDEMPDSVPEGKVASSTLTTPIKPTSTVVPNGFSVSSSHKPGPKYVVVRANDGSQKLILLVKI